MKVNKKKLKINTMNSDMKDTTEVLIANGSVIGLSLGQCNEALLFISESLAIAFTVYKFIKLKNKR